MARLTARPIGQDSLQVWGTTWMQNESKHLCRFGSDSAEPVLWETVVEASEESVRPCCEENIAISQTTPFIRPLPETHQQRLGSKLVS